MKKLLLSALLISSTLVGQAITVIKGTIKTSNDRSFLISLKEVVPFSSGKKPLLVKINTGNRSTFSLKTALKTAGFYSLSVVMEAGKNKSVNTSVLYLNPNQTLNLEYLPIGSFGLTCNYSKIKDLNNQALVGIQEKYNQQSRVMFQKNLDTAGLKTDLQAFFFIADSLTEGKKLAPEVQKYLKFKAFDTYQSNLFRFSSDYIRASKTKAQLPASYYNGPVAFLPYYQDPVVELFPNATYNLIKYIELQTKGAPFNKRKTLAEVSSELNWIKQRSLAPNVVDDLVRYLLSAYINTYKVSADFDQELKDFNVQAENIKDAALRNQIKKSFENLRYTMKGAALPLVSFENMAGDTVNLASFKGKYLFIDLWASWCVPCIKMTPYVQALEKQYEGRNINFVAISIDANRQNWLSKMRDLQLHGHQYLDLPGAFAKQLNITGIPHYLIYDKEGKLLVFQTDMPDNPSLKALIDGLPGL
ncbi:TlpA family protein disulfide reductase [Pedobacter polysacchareus]|uniref:TlpA family protein disulfide reductase n=1 Tax=Pedobacter polysacchareus TaxID=2861973 RepID=UPI001C9A14AD|nr:TlpA disulfide reductase family protein [Pedobacter polysacchareus]